MKGPPATVALFCGAFVVLLLPPLTSYFFRLFPLLGEIRLTFVDIFILWVFCMLYAIICHHKGVQLHRSPAAERCPFAAHTPLKAAQGRILPVSCQGYILPLFHRYFTAKSLQEALAGVRASMAFVMARCPCKHSIWGQTPLVRDALEPYASAVHQPFTG